MRTSPWFRVTPLCTFFLLVGACKAPDTDMEAPADLSLAPGDPGSTDGPATMTDLGTGASGDLAAAPPAMVGFAAMVNYAVGTEPSAIAIADFDSDGLLDLVVGNSLDHTVSVLRNQGSGVFPTNNPVKYPVGQEITSLIVSDLDGDGWPDLAIANGNDGVAGAVSVLINKKNGTFPTTEPAIYPVGTRPKYLAVGDLNYDSKPDLAVANQTSGSVSLLVNNGDGTFPKNNPRVLTVGDTPYSVAIGDLNGDGWGDLAVANASSNNLSVFRSKGDGTFLAVDTYRVGTLPYALGIGDLDGNAPGDIAVAHYRDGVVKVLLNKGTGTFPDPAPSYVAGTQLYGLTLRDLNRDGLVDIIVTNQDTNKDYVAVLLNRGDGTYLANGATFPTGKSPAAVAIGDLDGDGHLDLVTANRGANNVSVLINTSL